jgi:hypothetical protein
MNGNTDFDRMAQSWLQDGPTEMPDRSLQAALDEVHVTSQQRFALLEGQPMNGNTWQVAAAAVIGLVIIVGITFLGWRQGGVGSAGRDSVIGTDADTVRLARVTGDAGVRAPGGVRLERRRPRVPGAGPTASRAMYGRAKSPGARRLVRVAALFGQASLRRTPGRPGWLAGAWSSMGSVRWRRTRSDPARGDLRPAETGTVDGLVAAMGRWPGFAATAPAPTVVGGYSGQLVELTSTRTDTDCPNGAMWTIPGRTINAYPMVGAPGNGRGHDRDRGRQRHVARHPDDGLPWHGSERARQRHPR